MCYVSLACLNIKSNVISFLWNSIYVDKVRSVGRSALSDATTNIFKVVTSVIHDATEHLANLEEHEPEVAVVNPHDQPEFMHNLLFQ